MTKRPKFTVDDGEEFTRPETTESETPPVSVTMLSPLDALQAELADLRRRVDLLYRWTVGDRTGYRYPVPNFALGREKTHPGVFPEPDYECQGGPRKPQGEP